MSIELQARAKALLQRSIPASINASPNSIAERMIAVYAQRGGLPDDAEVDEQLTLAAMESIAMADQHAAPGAGDYFRENAAILEVMLAERV